MQPHTLQGQTKQNKKEFENENLTDSNRHTEKQNIQKDKLKQAGLLRKFSSFTIVDATKLGDKN